MVDPRFLKTSGVEAFTGNELLVKGALEAGVGLITGYPGSPVSDVFEAISMIAPYMTERGLVAQIANNEALATARLGKTPSSNPRYSDGGILVLAVAAAGAARFLATAFFAPGRGVFPSQLSGFRVFGDTRSPFPPAVTSRPRAASSQA